MSDKYKKRKYEMRFLNGDFIIKGKKAIQTYLALCETQMEKEQIFLPLYICTLYRCRLGALAISSTLISKYSWLV